MATNNTKPLDIFSPLKGALLKGASLKDVSLRSEPLKFVSPAAYCFKNSLFCIPFT